MFLDKCVAQLTQTRSRKLKSKTDELEIEGYLQSKLGHLGKSDYNIVADILR